jgi:lipopolysaccharide/colanic/teichoic acid biosynthesis glycosyltransferase
MHTGTVLLPPAVAHHGDRRHNNHISTAARNDKLCNSNHQVIRLFITMMVSAVGVPVLSCVGLMIFIWRKRLEPAMHFVHHSLPDAEKRQIAVEKMTGLYTI